MGDKVPITVNGQTFTVEIRELRRVERLTWSEHVSYYFNDVDYSQETFRLSAQQIEFCESMIEEMTPLDEETIEILTMEQFITITTACMQRIAGVDISVGDDESESIFDFNDNGTVNLEDWR